MADEYKDYYGILGVDPTSSSEELSLAYRRLARQYHPDVNPHDVEAGERFKEINEAYRVLSDSETRAEYDRQGANRFASWAPEGASEGSWQDRWSTGRSTSGAAGQVDGEEVGALLQQVADGFAREMREALLEFGDELESLSQMFRAAQSNGQSRQGFPAPPLRGQPPHHGRPPYDGKPPHDGKPPKP